jgi:hypothetical protein
VAIIFTTTKYQFFKTEVVVPVFVPEQCYGCQTINSYNLIAGDKKIAVVHSEGML